MIAHFTEIAYNILSHLLFSFYYEWNVTIIQLKQWAVCDEPSDIPDDDDCPGLLTLQSFMADTHGFGIIPPQPKL